MTEEEIKQLISNGENQEVEFKESLPSKTDLISKNIAAFANTQGGVIILGVRDNGGIVGLDEDLDKMQKRVNEINKSVNPPPILEIKVHNIESKNVLLVNVNKAANNMYHTFKGAIYVRMGSVTQRLEGSSQMEYLRDKKVVVFDESYDPSVTLDDIEKNKVQRYLDLRNQDDFFQHHTLEEFFVSNRLATKNGSLRVKNAAILVFGKDPSKIFPQIEIKLALFDGKEAINVIAHKIVKADLVGCVYESVQFVKSHLERSFSVDQESIKREDKYKIPISVIRESIVNAVVHRDYYDMNSIQISMFDDRLEITNPGVFPKEISHDYIGTISVQRNLLIYRLLRDFGLIEGLGLGIPRMRSEMIKASCPEPEFLTIGGFTRVVLRKI